MVIIKHTKILKVEPKLFRVGRDCDRDGDGGGDVDDGMGWGRRDGDGTMRMGTRMGMAEWRWGYELVKAMLVGRTSTSELPAEGKLGNEMDQATKVLHLHSRCRFSGGL